MTSTTPSITSSATPHPRPLPDRSVGERARRDDVASIPSTLRSEWIKLTTLRSNVTILALAPIIGVLLSWILAVFVEIDPDTDKPFNIAETFVFSTWLTTVLAALAGILMFTSEVQHGTMATAVAAQPARWVIVAAKTAIAACFGLAMGALGMIGGLSGAILGGLESGDTADMAAKALWGLFVATLAPIMGLGIGMILRHSAAAVSILLVWVFVVENLLRTLVPANVHRFLPFSAANGLLGTGTGTAAPDMIAAELSRTQNAFLFGGFAAAALALGTVLLSRRDMT
jgi:ABC-type transport system involved in multi-copper enzyme maturation permease subunit